MPGALADKLGAHLATVEPGGFVFTRRGDGKPLRSSAWRTKVWLSALEAAGLEHMRIHDLRHTAASLMIATKTSVLVVARQLGHKNPSMTLDRYSHLFADDLDDLGTALDAIYRSPTSATAPEVAALPVAAKLGSGPLLSMP